MYGAWLDDARLILPLRFGRQRICLSVEEIYDFPDLFRVSDSVKGNDLEPFRWRNNWIVLPRIESNRTVYRGQSTPQSENPPALSNALTN